LTIYFEKKYRNSPPLKLGFIRNFSKKIRKIRAASRKGGKLRKLVPVESL
jgi:hypothetical protein